MPCLSYHGAEAHAHREELLVRYPHLIPPGACGYCCAIWRTGSVVADECAAKTDLALIPCWPPFVAVSFL